MSEEKYMKSVEGEREEMNSFAKWFNGQDAYVNEDSVQDKLDKRGLNPDERHSISKLLNILGQEGVINGVGDPSEFRSLRQDPGKVFEAIDDEKVAQGLKDLAREYVGSFMFSRVSDLELEDFDAYTKMKKDIRKGNLDEFSLVDGVDAQMAQERGRVFLEAVVRAPELRNETKRGELEGGSEEIVEATQAENMDDMSDAMQEYYDEFSAIKIRIKDSKGSEMFIEGSDPIASVLGKPDEVFKEIRTGAGVQKLKELVNEFVESVRKFMTETGKINAHALRDKNNTEEYFKKSIAELVEAEKSGGYQEVQEESSSDAELGKKDLSEYASEEEWYKAHSKIIKSAANLVGIPTDSDYFPEMLAFFNGKSEIGKLKKSVDEGDERTLSKLLESMEKVYDEAA